MNEFEKIQKRQLKELIDIILDSYGTDVFIKNCRVIKEETNESDYSFAVTKLALINTIIELFQPFSKSSKYTKVYNRILRSGLL